MSPAEIRVSPAEIEVPPAEIEVRESEIHLSKAEIGVLTELFSLRASQNNNNNNNNKRTNSPTCRQPLPWPNEDDPPLNLQT
jgi:hypothetical protein